MVSKQYKKTDASHSKRVLPVAALMEPNGLPIIDWIMVGDTHTNGLRVAATRREREGGNPPPYLEELHAILVRQRLTARRVDRLLRVHVALVADQHLSEREGEGVGSRG